MFETQPLSNYLLDSTVGFVGSMSSLFRDEGVPVLRGKNIKPFEIDFEDLKFINQETHANWRKSQLRAGDVVLVRVGAPGTCCVIPEHLGDLNAASLVILRTNPKVLDPYFLSVFFNSREGRRQVESLTVGSVQSVFNVKTAHQIQIPVVEIKEQLAISAMVASINRKIELNRKSNETLEGIAKALFKSWFVDFDPVRAKAEGRPTGLPDEISELFPDSFEESELGEIPSGWTICPLGELSSISSGKRPTSVFDSRTPQAPYPLFGGAGIMGYTNESLIENRLVITTGRVGTLGKFHRIKEAVWVSDNALIIEPDKSIYHHVLHALLNVDISAMNRGSTQPLITQKDLKSIEILKGSVLIHELFEGLCGGIFNAIDCRGRESSVLSELRDALLPRLISGELRVPDAEKMLEEVGI